MKGRIRSLSPFSGRVRHRAVASTTYSIVGFQGETTEYIFRIDAVDFDGSTVTVDYYMERNGDSAIVDDNDITLFVGGSAVDTSTRTPLRSGASVTLTGPASSGQTVTVEWRTTQQTSRPENPDEHVVSLSGTVPQDGGDSGCSTDADCPEGFVCENGECVESGGGGDDCETDADCPEGFICVAGECVESGGGNGDFDPSAVSVDGCGVGTQKVNEGERLPLSSTVSNGNDQASFAVVRWTIGGDVVGETTAKVSANATVEVSTDAPWDALAPHGGGRSTVNSHVAGASPV